MLSMMPGTGTGSESQQHRRIRAVEKNKKRRKLKTDTNFGCFLSPTEDIYTYTYIYRMHPLVLFDSYVFLGPLRSTNFTINIDLPLEKIHWTRNACSPVAKVGGS